MSQEADNTRVWQVPELNTEAWAGVWARPSADRHTHSGLQLFLTTRGGAELVCAGQRLRLGPGTLLAIPPGVIHAIRPLAGQPWGFEVAYVEPHGVALLAENPTAPLAQPGPVRVAQATNALDAWARWQRIVAGPGASAQRRDALREVLRHLTDGQPMVHLPDLADQTDERLQAARALLDQEFADDVPIAELAEQVGLGPEHLTRLFTRCLGMPPHAYRVQRRVQEALRLLGRGKSPVEAALACGFTDQPHLNRHFARVVGLTPGRYRAAVKNVQDPQARDG